MKKSNQSNYIRLLLAICLFLISNVGISAQTFQITTFHHNIQGSAIAATDKDGALLWREEYTPYGEKQINAPLSKQNDNGYTGHTHFDDIGLTYMGARYYDPVVGRFMSTDPVGFTESNSASFNRYAYANNNPYKYVDPNGEVPAVLLWIVGATTLFDDLFFPAPVQLDEFNDAPLQTILTIPGPLGPVGKNASIVIGENMERVKRFSKLIGGETINDSIPRKAWSLNKNIDWANQVRSSNRTVIDIGPDFKRRKKAFDGGEKRPDKEAYNIEREIFNDYDGYNRAFDRNGKFEGGVEGFEGFNDL